MAPDPDWRSLLPSTDRYDNIQAIQAVCDPSHKSAFAIEDEAYKNSNSRDEYDAACLKAKAPPARQDTAASPEPEVSASPGEQIGAYANCHYIASGATSQVYRSGKFALKVIVETRNIEPHSPAREAKILGLLDKPVIPLLETFRDSQEQFTLVFPYMPLSLETLLDRGSLSRATTGVVFRHLFAALRDIHGQGIIHRDVKPSAILLESPDGPAYLSDFGTAWHPTLSAASEPAAAKILDVGTGPYRAPEALFGNKAYGPALDMWAAGVVLSECCRAMSSSSGGGGGGEGTGAIFESRAAHEDGNQLGLILSIFKTIGSPTRESWPEARAFKTAPFDMYRVFEGRAWPELLPGADEGLRDLVARLVRYESGERATAAAALNHSCLQADGA